MTTIFSPDEVKSLNAYQNCEYFHGYTCGSCNSSNTHIYLIATGEGLMCPKCRHIQTWAHDSDKDWSWTKLKDGLDKIFKKE